MERLTPGKIEAVFVKNENMEHAETTAALLYLQVSHLVHKIIVMKMGGTRCTTFLFQQFTAINKWTWLCV